MQNMLNMVIRVYNEHTYPVLAILIVVGLWVVIKTIRHWFVKATLLIPPAVVAVGVIAARHGHLFYGIAIGFVGACLFNGYTWPKDPQTSKVWLITVFGWLSPWKSTGLTWLLKPFVGKVEIDLQMVEHNFKLNQNVRCMSGGYLSKDTSSVAISMLPDNTDDPCGHPRSMTAGQKLRAFKNAGGWEGIKRLHDEILTVIVQMFANCNPAESMEIYSHEMSRYMLPVIRGETSIIAPLISRDLTNSGGLGITYKKLLPVLRPDQATMTARQNLVVQESTRRLQVTGTQIMEEQVVERMTRIRLGVVAADGTVIIPPTPPERMPTFNQARSQILEEDLAQRGLVQEVMNAGGVTVVRPARGTTPP